MLVNKNDSWKKKIENRSIGYFIQHVTINWSSLQAACFELVHSVGHKGTLL